MEIPNSVRNAFALEGKAMPLEGGQATSMRFDDVVIKPVDDPAYYNFASHIFYDLKPNGYRISKPLKTSDGKFIVDGYGASEFKDGKHDFHRLDNILDVSQKLHQDLQGLKDYPLPKTNNPWAYAHEVLWRDEQIPQNWHKQTDQLISFILNSLVEINLPHQIIHSDIGGNVLFHDYLLPLVIDFSPTYAPYAYANAIAVCDNIAWGEYDLNALELLQPFSHYQEMIKYAVAFRVLTMAFFDHNNFQRINGEWAAFKAIWNTVA